MSAAYTGVGWNRQKRVYDLVVAGAVALYLAVFVTVGAALLPHATIETLIIRALGTCAILLLHVVLSIGPLSRLDPRFLPLLFNRRHLGVVTFLAGLAHALFATVQFHALGDVDPLTSILTSNGDYHSLSQFPFQVLGLGALAILFLMAATSHDFWLQNLTAPVWKSLHMAVYFAYALLVAHVVLGALQSERSPVLAAILGGGAFWIFSIHIAAALRERAHDLDSPAGTDGWVGVCSPGEIREGRAHAITVAGERVAVYRHAGGISAISAVCRHQNGPLAEGRIVDGCITCPWHGYQYLPETGASPPPFTETLPTFRVRIREGIIQVHCDPLAPGTRVEPASLGGGA